METPSPVRAAKHARATLANEEQSLCLEALESGAYDDMSDQEWVALCERLAADARHHDAPPHPEDTLDVVADLIKPAKK